MESLEGSQEEKEIVVAFDLHHVLARPTKLNMITCCFSFTSMLEKVKWCAYGLNPFFWCATVKLLRERAIPERIIKKLSMEYPGLLTMRAAELIQEISNGQTPHLETWNVVYRLKQEGHTLCLASNITTSYLFDLRQKWEALSPLWKEKKKFSHLPADLFSLLDYCFTTDEIDDYQRKPSPEYFARWQQFVEQRSNGNSVDSLFFIDDSVKNVFAVGISGNVTALHYTGVDKLEIDLEKQNLL